MSLFWGINKSPFLTACLEFILICSCATPAWVGPPDYSSDNSLLTVLWLGFPFSLYLLVNSSTPKFPKHILGRHFVCYILQLWPSVILYLLRHKQCLRETIALTSVWYFYVARAWMQGCQHLVGKLKMAAMAPQSKACFFRVATILTFSNPILQTTGNQCFFFW